MFVAITTSSIDQADVNLLHHDNLQLSFLFLVLISYDVSSHEVDFLSGNKSWAGIATGTGSSRSDSIEII